MAKDRRAQKRRSDLIEPHAQARSALKLASEADAASEIRSRNSEHKTNAHYSKVTFRVHSKGGPRISPFESRASSPEPRLDRSLPERRRHLPKVLPAKNRANDCVF